MIATASAGSSSLLSSKAASRNITSPESDDFCRILLLLVGLLSTTGTFRLRTACAYANSDRVLSDVDEISSASSFRPEFTTFNTSIDPVEEFCRRAPMLSMSSSNGAVLALTSTFASVSSTLKLLMLSVPEIPPSFDDDLWSSFALAFLQGRLASNSSSISTGWISSAVPIRSRNSSLLVKPTYTSASSAFFSLIL